jgi:hypothetical protein
MNSHWCFFSGTAIADELINNGDHTVDVEFLEPVTASLFPTGSFVIEVGGIQYASTSAAQIGPDLVRFTNVNWPASTAGMRWRIANGPTNVLLPQTGLMES